jgi:methylated-DNA-[protein]-cysteine S-methyltransferase
MATRGFAVFDTDLGPCGIAWSASGVLGVQLPEGSAEATRARLLARFPDAAEASPPKAVARAADGVVALLAGRRSDLSKVALDLSGIPVFHRKVYAAARAIPRAATLTYGELAARAGAPGSARAAGQAMGRNPFPVIVPCHRVVAANGKPGGFSANGGVTTKLRMLAIEGAAPGGRQAATAGREAALPRSKATRGTKRAPSSASADVATRAPAAPPYPFDADAALRYLRKQDPALGRLIDAAGPFGLQLKTTSTVFGALAEAIVFQQLTGKAATTIFGRVRDLFAGAREAPTAEQIHEVAEDKLRQAGLSRAKTAALKDLARRALDGSLPTLAQTQAMDDATIIARLTEVRGVGRWTAQMLLMFRLGRPDVLASDDYALRKGYAIAFRKRHMPDRAALDEHGERWRPFRSVASWYLWRANELRLSAVGR